MTTALETTPITLQQLSRCALLPVLPHATPNALSQVAAKLPSLGETTFLRFLGRHKLLPTWQQAIDNSSIEGEFSQSFLSGVSQSSALSTGTYLLQREGMESVRGLLDGVSVPHVVFKGAHLRERFYQDPTIRPSVDIDILISPDDRVNAMTTLIRAGFTLDAPLKNISHEASLTKGSCNIDLHWDILRPGRTRIPLTPLLLDNRQNYSGYWGTSDEDSLFIALVHPVFSKYLAAPQASLIRMVDLALLLEAPGLDYEAVIQLLHRTGLKTAGWLSLQRLVQLTGHEPQHFPSRTLEPGPVRKKYLTAWLKNDWADRFAESPALTQIGLTLATHDKWSDALYAVRRSLSLQRSANRSHDRLMHDIHTLGVSKQ